MLSVLTKIKQNEIVLMLQAINFYIEHIKNKREITILDKNNFSIAKELQQEFFGKIKLDDLTKTFKLKLRDHKAIILVRSLLKYQFEIAPTSLNYAIIERIKNNLIEQSNIAQLL